MTDTPDRIEKQIVLKAPRGRVWKALTDTREFGAWFGVDLHGEFKEGETLRGKITIKGFTHVKWEATVERMQPEKLFSYRWHPSAVEPNVDYASEPTTLVTFELEDRKDGTLLRVVESGFDQIPLARRAQAYRSNTEGWGIQVTNIEKYVAQAG
jgi:uncharacterized protein YndB with AHSA1/START domain